MEALQLRIALDMGGTLTKAAFMTSIATKILIQKFQLYSFQILQVHTRSSPQKIQNQIYLMKFDKFQQILSLLKVLLDQDIFQSIQIITTGGGAVKHAQIFQNYKSQYKKLKYKQDHNQFQNIVQSFNLLNNPQYICKVIKSKNSYPIDIFETVDQNGQIIKSKSGQQYPILVANIGSGISLLKILEKQNKLTYQRIGGSALGGGYLMGLQKLNNPQFQFQKIDKKAQQSNQNQDKILSFWVQNIYQLLSLYSSISEVKNILIIGGVSASNRIKKQFGKFYLLQKQNIKNQESQEKFNNLYFSQIDGFSGVIGILNNQQKIQ